MLIQEPIQAAIWHCLNHYCYNDAIFLAERLHAEVQTDDTLFLLATSYYRAGKRNQCYSVLNKMRSLNPRNRFLLSQCCYDMNKLAEAEEILINRENPIDSLSQFGDSTPFACKLFGEICSQTDRTELSKESYIKSLRENPFLFHSFISICEVGCGLENLDPETIFQVTHLDNFASCHGTILSINDENIEKFISTPTQRSAKNMNSEDRGILHQSNRPAKFRNLFTSTPMGSATFTPLCLDSSESLNSSYCSSPFLHVPELAEPPRSKKPCYVPPSWLQQQTTQTQPSPQQQPLQTANVRRSSRLFTSNVSVKENNKTPPSPRQRLTPSKSPNRKIRNTSKSTTTFENQKNSEVSEDFCFTSPVCDRTPISCAERAINLQKQAAEGLMILLRDLGKCYLYLSRFECNEAIELLNSLKPQQYNSGWVLGLIAKSYFEMGDYEEAIRYYTQMLQSSPHRTEGLELLSTSYWHLQREIDLTKLSYDLMSTDRHSISTWITVGNCFSLHKEHETSIKFFKRAIQINPNFSYSYTLLGHEYVAIEEHEKAMRCFRNAIRINPRHYNAWYGIGMIFYKQERYNRAEIYYKKALLIHPNNNILLCHLGVVQQALNRTEESLATFSKALEKNPNDPLCKFHRASVLFSINRLDEALVELEELKQIVPKESLVYFLVAKVYSKKGETHKALLHFSWATDLDPKGANNQIKESIEPVLSKSLSAIIIEHGDDVEEETL